MWWNKNAKLCERASYNCIDLTGYLHYPNDIVEQILFSMEEGCTRNQVDKALRKGGRQETIHELMSMRAIPDVSSFTKKLSEPIRNVSGKDVREDIKSLELLLPDDKTRGWSSVSSHMTLQAIQKHTEEEPEITVLFLYFLAADRLVSSKMADYNRELNVVINSFFTGGAGEENKGIRTPGPDYMELLSMYYAASGAGPERAVEACGRTAAALGFSPRRTYHFMLETASLVLMVQKGTTAGCSFLRNHRLPARYGISQVGFPKKIHATLCPEPPFLLETCTAICRHPEKLSEVLFSRQPDRSLVLACQIFAEAVAHTEGIWKDITIPRETQQYVREILSYCRKEVTKNVWDNK